MLLHFIAILFPMLRMRCTATTPAPLAVVFVGDPAHESPVDAMPGSDLLVGSGWLIEDVPDNLFLDIQHCVGDALAEVFHAPAPQYDASPIMSLSVL
jgi:hypothetical protein